MKGDKRISHCNMKAMAVPISVICHKCGHDVELWSDEEEVPCPACGRKVFKTEGPWNEKARLSSSGIS